MALFDFLKKRELEEISRLSGLLKKYEPILEIDKEKEIKLKELNDLKISVQLNKDETKKQFEQLNSEYQAALGFYSKLKQEVSLFESKLDLIEFGVYEPEYNFDRSDDYRKEQERICNLQKEMITNDRAAICNVSWTVEGSEAKGRTVVKRYKKLMLRAFNGECDSLIAKVKWNNVNQMKERMYKLFESLNKLGEGFSVYIDSGYFRLKQQELILEYEFQAKRQQEKEEMRRIQEELREEEKVKREIELATRQAEKEEAQYEKELSKAKSIISNTQGEEQEKLLEKIKELEFKLNEAQEKKERALSMAQQTRRGHVYIISNIGSFGDNVYKIGMTRRLDPEDRIKELGDASVPFGFDIHAMIFSEDAPALESQLHQAFDKKKLNMVNNRKEFFKVTLEEIEAEVKKTSPSAQFITFPEAMEYKETLAIIARIENSSIEKPKEVLEEFPLSLTL